MYLLTSRWKLVIIIGIILTVGFVSVNLASYYVSSNSVRSALINNELPLISNNIYSEIQASLLRPIYISSLMAHNTFVQDWMLEGEKRIEKITKYLAEIKNKYKVSSTFLVSAKTHHYYHSDGILKTVSKKTSKDNWFFTMAAHTGNYRVEVDSNEANRNHLTIFVNHKLFDYDGNFTGVTGLGLDAVNVAKMIDRYKNSYQRNIYFVDRNGQVKSHPERSLIDKVNIQKMPGIESVAKLILSSKSGFLTYKNGGENILTSYRYIPELDWFLLVEQTEGKALQPIRRALYSNLLISAVITLLVLLISSITIHRFQFKLETMAKTDKLTGLINRQYFDILFAHALDNVGRHTSCLSLALFDLDNLKKINDRQGHLAGDQILSAIASLTRKQLRKSDVVARWGGDEFAILLQKCDAVTAIGLMNNIRQNITSTLNHSKTGFPVSISVGVAEYRSGDTSETLLARADKYMYEAKRKGRNRVEGPAS